MAEAKRIFLLPGESTYAKRKTTISTLLGSCIAVCLYDWRNKTGGMNHYMLPTQKMDGLAPGKYGDFAIESLIEVALRTGAKRHNLVASIYGGGHVIGHLDAAAKLGATDVGAKNIAIAHELLKKNQIEIIKAQTGGDQGRKIAMDSETNEITMRPIARIAANVQKSAVKSLLKKRKIRVLIIDDSATVRRILRRGIESSDDLEVAGEAENPFEAREMILEYDPDLLCLDIIMPRMDGLTFLKKIMRYKPIPTVIVSTIAKKGSEMRKNVLAAGASGVLDKDELHIYRGTEAIEKQLLPALRNAVFADVKGKEDAA